MAYVLDTNSIKSQLYNMNRDYYGEQSWRKLYLQTSLAEQQALSNLQYDYGQAINEAYASAMQQESAIQSSALGQGYKDALLYDTESALREAFDSYRQNYQSAVSTIQQETATSNQAITDELTKQAQYTTKMFDSSFNYLQDLFNLYNDGEIVDDKGQVVNIFATEDNWKKYTTTDENGQIRLKTKDELLAGGVDNEGLVDKEGNLTIAGVDFFDQMLNEQAFTGRGKSFGSWLRETDEDLYNWAQAYNPYDYTEAGTNFGSFKTMFGMSSTDDKYLFLERFGGWSESMIKNKFAQFETNVSELRDKYSKNGEFKGKKAEDYISDVSSLTNDLLKVAKEFGIDTSSVEIEQINEQVSQLLSKSMSKDELNADFWGDVGIGATTGSTAGAGVGQIVGTAAGAYVGLPSVGAGAGRILGGIIGGAVGGIIGIITGSVSDTKNKKMNKEYMQQAEDIYLNAVNQMLQYALTERQKIALSK